jgi:hypothetical protein
MECEQEMVMGGSSERGAAVAVPTLHPPVPLYVISTSTAGSLVPTWMAADPVGMMPTICVWWDYPPS